MDTTKAIAALVGLVLSGAAPVLGQTSTTTTSTLLPCVATPPIAALDCQLGQLAQLIDTASGVGRPKAKLANQVGRARRNVEGAAAATSARRARTHLKRAQSALRSLAFALRSPSGQRSIEGPARTQLQTLASQAQATLAAALGAI